jgi:vacuolar-type H+-ATPase subunit I/STV1
MNIDDKLGKLRTLIHNEGIHFQFVDMNQYIEHLNKKIAYLETHINEDKKCPKTVKERYFALKEIRNLIIDTNISVKELYEIYYDELRKKIDSKKSLEINNLKETRDNKGVYVGGGGFNANMVRYPKKKLSLKVWKIFYSMFPDKAKKDNFDGKTSDRMK